MASLNSIATSSGELRPPLGSQEVVAERPLEEFLRLEILEKLQLTETFFQVDRKVGGGGRECDGKGGRLSRKWRNIWKKKSGNLEVGRNEAKWVCLGCGKLFRFCLSRCLEESWKTWELFTRENPGMAKVTRQKLVSWKRQLGCKNFQSDKET